MSKFNIKDKRHTPAAPIKTNPVPTVHTYNGAAGYEYDTLSQLFLLACSNMVSEDTFYEKASDRDIRFSQLIEKAVIEGHLDWLTRFFPWLRNQANMRSAATIGAMIAAKSMASLGIPGGRKLINSVLVRADEPGEMIAAYVAMFGSNIPKPIKRGIADAVGRLYTERSLLKYDTASHGYRFADVIELAHPKPAWPGQGDLFKVALERRHNRADQSLGNLPMLQANALLRREAAKRPEALLNAARLSQAGMTWEDVLSLAGSKLDKAALWTAMIPSMGYMGILRNLRNFDEAGIKGGIADVVAQKLINPDEVKRSRQLPMRFLSAHRNVPSNRWAYPLEVALELCLKSLPNFPGRTLILIDTSYSMHGSLSAKSQLQRWEAAVIFGVALAHRCNDATVVSFSTDNKVFPEVKGESLLKSIDRFRAGYFYGNNTATGKAVRDHYRNHDRVICLTDEQADSDGWSVFLPVPEDKMVVTFNLAGYRQGHAPAGTKNRVTIGGLSDAAWQLLPALEGRAAGQWPF